jgi:hypothetical protein
LPAGVSSCSAATISVGFTVYDKGHEGLPTQHMSYQHDGIRPECQVYGIHAFEHEGSPITAASITAEDVVEHMEGICNSLSIAPFSRTFYRTPLVVLA